MTRLSSIILWLWSPITALWGEVKGLRTEEIRSSAFVFSAGVTGYTLSRVEAEMVDPWFVLALIGFVMMVGLAWQATSIKGQWGAVMLQLGRDPDPDNRMTAQDSKPESDDAQ